MRRMASTEAMWEDDPNQGGWLLMLPHTASGTGRPKAKVGHWESHPGKVTREEPQAQGG